MDILLLLVVVVGVGGLWYECWAIIWRLRYEDLKVMIMEEAPEERERERERMLIDSITYYSKSN